MENEHIPVMLQECIDALKVKDNGRYIDCTIGGAGHSSLIMKSAKNVHLLGFDADRKNFNKAKKRLAEYGDNVSIVNTNFVNLKEEAEKLGFEPVDGILFDLGLSSMQLSEDGAGFSFQYDAPLDMRFNTEEGLTAADIVNSYSEKDIADLIFKYGEETQSRKIARAIVSSRPIRTTTELANIILGVIPKRGKIHPATKTFQALRIAVNNELDNLESALQQAIELLDEHGRLVIMSYHSLEDRIVKTTLKEASITCKCPPGLPVCTCNTIPRLIPVTHKVVVPGEEEIKYNPRSRSAKLRVAERINKNRT